MSEQNTTSRKAIAIFVFLEVLIIAVAWWVEDNQVIRLQTAARLSGRLSLFVFSAIMIFFTNQALLSRLFSRQFYLLFAVVHGVHLLELLMYVQLSGTQLIPYRLAGGFLAYMFIFIMPWLAYRFFSGEISKQTFTTAESIYLYYIWFIFLMAYLPRVMSKLPNAGGRYAAHLALFVWVLIVLILHLVIRFRKHNVVNA